MKTTCHSFPLSEYIALKQGPTVGVFYDDSINMSDLDIDPEIKETILQCVTKLSVDNHS